MVTKNELRKAFNETNPIHGGYTAMDQQRAFVKLHPVVTEGPTGEEMPIPIPTIGESGSLNLSAALAEKEYLQNHPAPRYGWSSGVANRIETRLMTLNTLIADIVLKERKTENGN